MKAFLTLQHGISSDTTDTNNSKNSVVSLGTLYLELYHHDVPITVSNFVTLLQQGQQQQEQQHQESTATKTRTKNKLGYQGCIFHRIIPKFMAQGGDMSEHISSRKDNTTIVIDDDDDNNDTNNNYKTFPDENFIHQHDKVGILSMANSGPNTNQTQFFITFRPTPHLNNKHVVFGHVDLLKSNITLNALENIPCHPKTNRPYRPVVIVRCGLLPDDYDSMNPISPLHNNTMIASDHGQANTWSNQDDDEIDLDDDDDDHNNNNINNNNSLVSPPQQQEEEELVVERDDETIPMNTKLSKKKELMKIRMRQLKQKMNQAKQLNQQAVREEGEMNVAKTTMTGSNNNNNHQKQRSSNHHIIQQNQNSHGVQLAKESNIDIKILLQPAYENVMKQQRKQEKDELNQYDIKDYHNPEGQYRNYVRNIRSLPNNNNNNDNNNTNLYDPTDIVTEDGVGTLKKERDAAHIISMELHRRIEKRQKKDRKRKQEQIRKELNDTSSSSVAASGINLRNQKFNEKIARTFDAATSEIRHNLERGTAL